MLSKEKLEQINYKVTVWKIPFYELVGGTISLIEFEHKVYKIPDLESIIGEDIYIELVSFYFSKDHIYNVVVDLILDKILVDENEYDCKLFALIGEFYLNDFESKIKHSKSLPEAVVSIFEGAHIFVHGKGVDNPACDIDFLSEIRHLNKFKKDCRNALPLSSVIIGYALNSDIELIMDYEGVVYINLHTNELFYGGNFLEALRILFFGWNYGKRLC